MKKQSTLKPAEKWNRMNHPASLDDYGLIMDRTEMLQVPELVPLVKAVDSIREEMKVLGETCRKMGEKMRHEIDAIILQASRLR